MSEDEPDAEAVEEPPAKKKPPLILLIGGGVLLLIVVAALAALLILGKKKPAPAPSAKKDATASALDFGAHIDNADENAQRAAALARQAAEGNPQTSANTPGGAAR